MPVLVMTLWAVVVTATYKTLKSYNNESTPGRHIVQHALRALSLETGTNQFLSISLMLVLTIRMNQAYLRWLEGRTLWGRIVNRSRAFASQARSWVHSADLQATLIRYTVAFAYATKHRLRDELRIPELQDDKLVPLQVRLVGSELEEVEASAHMPVHCLCVLQGLISKAYALRGISEMQLKAMDENITDLTDSLGGCERIQKTPFPVSYVLHSRIFTLVYLFFLPMTLVAKSGWGTILWCFLVAVGLMGVEHMSEEIAQPFGYDIMDLKLDTICTNIHLNLAQISGFRKSYSLDGTSTVDDSPAPSSATVCMEADGMV